MRKEKISRSTEVTPYTEKDGLDFIGDQIIITDPQYQAYGLVGMERMDNYANKFFILSNPDGVYISPSMVPQILIEYYRSLGIKIAKPENIFSYPNQNNEPLISRAKRDKSLIDYLKGHKGKSLAPYKLTSSE